jgi:hypothetical protein
MKFKTDQSVKIIATGEIKKIIRVELLSGRFYRLEDQKLYLESELEPIEKELETTED